MQDLFVAFYRVAKTQFGEMNLRGVRTGWWKVGRADLEFASIRTGPRKHDSENGITGAVEILPLQCVFQFGENIPLVCAIGVHPSCNKAVENFLDAIGAQLKNASIYKGRAINVEREFLDLSAIDDEIVVYGTSIKRELEAHIWSLIRRGDVCRSAGVSQQRKVLLAGPFGCGKTLTAFVTAKIATDHGYTFIYLPPTYKSMGGEIPNAFQLARRYEPAVVFIEDMEYEQRHEEESAFRNILNAIDGLPSKSSRILTIMTANRPDKIAGGMQRPGRIDHVVDFTNYAHNDVVRLLISTIPELYRSADIDWDRAAQACKDFTPAFVREVSASAKLLAISEARDGTQPKVTTEMLVSAAESLLIQHNRCREALGFTS